MKAIVFCLLNFFICFFVQAQSYHSFMHDTAIWSEQEYIAQCCEASAGVYFEYDVNFIMMDDTIINGISYKKIYRQVTAENSGGNFFCSQLWWGEDFYLDLIGFTREDSSKRVYFLANQSYYAPPAPCVQENFDVEKILYDFGLGLGDTASWKPFYNIVIGIDSELAPNGELLRTISFGGDKWIEGLGSINGFFGAYEESYVECGCYLLCAEATDLLPPGSPPPCGGIVNAVREHSSLKKLQITPNPFSDLISLTSPFQSSSILSVINSQGQIILKKELLPLEKISFSNQDLKFAGVILFRLVSDDGKVRSGIAVHSF